MSLIAWGLLIALSLLWGGSFFFAEIALRELGPLTIVAARVSLAALALLIVLRVAGLRLPTDRHTLLALLIMGALNNAIPFSLIVWGQVYLSSGVASILNATTPLFTVLLAHALTRDERITLNKFTGVVVGLIGVAVLIGPSVFDGLHENFLAQIAILLAAISYAFASIYGKRLRTLPTTAAATGMLLGSSLLLLPLAFIFENPVAVIPTSEVLISVLGLAFLSSALAYLIYFHILVIAGATNLMLVTLLVPVSAILLGVTILAEDISIRAYVGMAVIFMGLICIDGRALPQRFQSKPRSANETS